MKILFLGRYSENSVFTGPEKVAGRIFALASAEYEAVFVTYFFDGRKYGIMDKLFGKETVSAGNLQVMKLGIFRILFFMLSFKPDIIHIIGFERFAVLSYRYKLLSHPKIIYTVHGIAAIEDGNNPLADDKLKKKDIFAEQKFLGKSDKLIFLSEISVRTAESVYKIDKNKIIIIPNGVDKIFHTTGLSKKINFNFPLRLVFTGDPYNKQKGFEFLITALNEIKFSLELFVIADLNKGDEDDLMKGLNESTTLRVIPKMAEGEYPEFLSDKDIYVSAASYEQFSIAAVESMAAGLVPIVTEETGMSSYIENNFNGFKVNFGDKEELIRILQLLESDRNILGKVSKEAVGIYPLLSWEKVFDKYKKLYE